MVYLKRIFIMILAISYGLCSDSDIERKHEDAVNDMRTLPSRLVEVERSLQDQQIDNDRVIVLGQTGDGKSTLINYLAGNKLVYRETDESVTTEPKVVLDGEGLKIGHGFVAMTRSIDSLAVDGLGRVYDTPGFHGTGSTTDVIIDMCFLDKIIRSSGRIKLIFTAPASLLEDQRGNIFKEYATELKRYLPGDRWNSCLESAIIVFTKYQQQGSLEEDIANVTSVFMEVARHTEEASSFASKFSDDRVCIFYEPEDEGKRVDAPDREKILSSIGGVHWYSIPEGTRSRDLVLNDQRLATAMLCVNRACTAKLDRYFEKISCFLRERSEASTVGDMNIKITDLEEYAKKMLTAVSLRSHLEDMSDVANEDTWIRSISVLLPSSYNTEIESVLRISGAVLEEYRRDLALKLSELRTMRSTEAFKKELKKIEDDIKAAQTAAQNSRNTSNGNGKGKGGGGCSIM